LGVVLPLGEVLLPVQRARLTHGLAAVLLKCSSRLPPSYSLQFLNRLAAETVDDC
ncbi:hypothetical protein NDU88_004697, partial [Pleurodeles waltl]